MLDHNSIIVFIGANNNGKSQVLNVTVIRTDRMDSINKMSILQNVKIKKLWGNPLLRYSNILSGLFHEKVVVCESDYGCLMKIIYDSMNAKCSGGYDAWDQIKKIGKAGFTGNEPAAYERVESEACSEF